MEFDAIAEFALGPTPIPDAVRDMAATLLIDTLGVAAGAVPIEAGRIARDHVVRFQAAARGTDAATLMFDGRRAAMPGVAYAAATQIDNLDAHDGFNLTKGHIGCATVPGLCVFAEGQPDLSGPAALDHLVISYEIAARAAIALHSTVSDYHTSGAWNALGVAALACRIRGASAEVLRQALGIAEYHGPRSQMMREIANPTMLHDGSGMGALVGSMAALLAEDGFAGAPAITVEDAEVANLWDDLGQRWTILENYIKPYPICRWAHAALDAAHALQRTHGFAADDVARVTVRTFEESAALYPGVPETASQAQYALAYPIAVLLVHGAIGPKHTIDPLAIDPEVLSVINRVDVHEDARHSSRFPQGRWSDVDVHLRDGRVLSSGDCHARGGPEAPMGLDEVEAKFHLMAADLPEPRRQAIWSAREGLQSETSKFSDLLSLIHPAIG